MTTRTHPRRSAALPGFRSAALALLLAFAAAAGCGRNAPEPIRIGMNAFPAYELLYLAQEQGFYAEEGVAVRIVELSSLSDTRLALENGQIDGAATTLVDLIIAASRQKVTAGVVWVIDASTGGDMIIAREPVRSVVDLKGRRVGLEVDSLGIEVLARALELSGLSLADVKPVAVDQPGGKDALAQGQIDALVTYPPASSAALRQPGTREIFDTSAIPDEVIDVLAFSREVLERRPDDVRRILRAYERALAYARAHEDEAVAIMAGRENVAPAEFRAAIHEDVRVLTRAEQAPYLAEGGRVERGIARGIRNLHALGRIDGALQSHRLRPEPAFAAGVPGSPP